LKSKLLLYLETSLPDFTGAGGNDKDNDNNNKQQCFVAWSGLLYERRRRTPRQPNVVVVAISWTLGGRTTPVHLTSSKREDGKRP
jgi:hypothetical protein